MPSSSLLKPSLLTTTPRLLIIAPVRWDEACFAWPAILALLDARKGNSTSLICADHQQHFWRDCPHLDAIICWKKTDSVRAISAQLRQDGQAFHCAWILENNPAAQACCKANIADRLGLAEGELTPLLTTVVTPPNRERPIAHRIQDHIHFLQHFHLDARRPEFFSPVRLESASSLPRLLISPESDQGRHYEWNLQSWSELINELDKLGHGKPLLLQLEGSRSTLTKQLHKAHDLETHSADLCNETSLRAILALGQQLIGADSSLIHLAAHHGLTTAALFGPNSIAWRRALGREHLQISQHVECSPCFQPRCHFDLRCQDQLTPRAVFQSIQRHFAMTD